jgi:hypothetical protein
MVLTGPPGILLQPVVLKFRVPLKKLAPLASLHFVLGDYDDERYWSFVQCCRQGLAVPPRNHGYEKSRKRQDWYDIVTGPVADFWRQRSVMRQADQVSFHTKKAVELLNDLIRPNDPENFNWRPV